MNMSVFKKQGFRVLVVAAVLLLLIAVAAAVIADRNGDREVTPVTEPSFALNGEDYPLAPVLQDFIDRGWRLGKSTEQTGSYVEGEGPMDLVATGYLLSSGEDHVNVYLNVDDCRSGQSPGECRLRSLRLYGEDVESFCLNGEELASVGSDQIADRLGDPDSVDEKELGTFYYYSLPENNISRISFSFLNSSDTVGQIFIIFGEKY